ncbi:MAG: hypothetical protein ACLFMX_01315 [Halobacteriales archaeon]
MDSGDDIIASLFESGRRNAVLSWLVVAVYLAVIVESLVGWDPLWLVFTLGMTGILLVPPVATRSPYVMLPWELLVLASFPVVVRTAEVSVLANDFASYVSMAAFAMLAIVELHVLTEVRVTHWFAVLTVGFATLAIAALWAIVRWQFDRRLGTGFLSTNDALMWEFVWVLLAGVVAGVLFDLYFRRRAAKLREDLEVTP